MQTVYIVRDTHNEIAPIRTHPENNCSCLREARKSRRHSRQAIHRYLHGWTGVWKHPLPPPYPSLQGTPRKNTMAHRVGDVQFEGERTLDRNVASSRDTTESSVSKVLSCKQVACKKPLLVTERTESFHLALSTLSPSSFRLVSFFFFLFFFIFPFSSFLRRICTRTICSFIRFARHAVLISSLHLFLILLSVLIREITCLVMKRRKLNKYSLNNSNLSKWSIG